MSAYVIADVEAIDPATYPSSPNSAAETISKYGGRYLVRNGRAIVREGEWQIHRMLVIEFDSMEAATRWYESPEYAPIKALRVANARSRVVIVQGVAP
jgi:uncharacterized protein (DUF1330 family)